MSDLKCEFGFEQAHQALHRFCKGEHRMCIPVQKDDDDEIISTVLDAAQSQLEQKDKRIKEIELKLSLALEQLIEYRNRIDRINNFKCSNTHVELASMDETIAKIEGKENE